MFSIRFLLLRVLAVVVAAVSVFFVVAGSGQAATLSSAAAGVEANIVPFMTQQLSEYANGPQPFANGVWTDTNPDGLCWSCADGGPLTAAATLYVLGGASDPTLLNEAEATINTAIATRQTPDGGFTQPSTDSTPEGISTLFFGVEFGTTYRLLAPYLDPATRAAWQRSLAAVGNYLIASNSTTYYVNGNINLGMTELLWLIWQATGQSQFLQDYNNSWNFTLNPPQTKFPGAGWITVQAPTQADGSDGTGYFAEVGAGGTGYDAEYSSLQLDVASRLYLLSGDPRALRAANMLMNMEMPRVNTSTWMLDTSNGTRHTQPNRYVGFMSSAMAVLGLDAGRSDLIPWILPQLKQEESWYPQPNQADSAVFRRAFGNSISTIALAAANADPPYQPTLAKYGLLGTIPTTTPTTGTIPVATPTHVTRPTHIPVAIPTPVPVTEPTTGTTRGPTPTGPTATGIGPTRPLDPRR